jgi:cyclopropane fatty-acyl-phospholipid synthase-like methyltransferase
MAKQNRYEELLSAPPASRNRVAERLYDECYANKPGRATGLPAKRRLKRIALYKSIVGRGHQAILELGCGSGDLTYALVDHAERIIGTDISTNAIEIAGMRKNLWSLTEAQVGKIEFKPMSAVQLDFPDGMFDWAVSTSMIEHLHPDDVDSHLREVRRVLKSGGRYLIWCPNGLGHHNDRDVHLTMLSYAEWTERLKKAGFCRFRSTLTSRLPVIGAGWKIFLERLLSALRIKIMWSHLGVRNVLLVGTK